MQEKIKANLLSTLPSYQRKIAVWYLLCLRFYLNALEKRSLEIRSMSVKLALALRGLTMPINSLLFDRGLALQQLILDEYNINKSFILSVVQVSHL